MANYNNRWDTALVEIDDKGIAWVTLNRPDKKNCMSPTLNREMIQVLNELELDNDAKIIVLTGAGDSWSAGMDLKEYFRETDGESDIFKERIRRDASEWQWKILRNYNKATIAMVNGWCFGGAFSPLGACDLAYCADEATFGLSEINWGITPGNLVSRAVADSMGYRNAMYYVMTGETWNGKEAETMGLVNKSVPLEDLKSEVVKVAEKLLEKNPTVLRLTKQGFKRCREFTWEQNEDYLYAKTDQSNQRDTEKGRADGLKQFLDDKTIKPGLQTYKRE